MTWSILSPSQPVVTMLNLWRKRMLSGCLFRQDGWHPSAHLLAGGVPHRQTLAVLRAPLV